MERATLRLFEQGFGLCVGGGGGEPSGHGRETSRAERCSFVRRLAVMSAAFVLEPFITPKKLAANNLRSFYHFKVHYLR